MRLVLSVITVSLFLPYAARAAEVCDALARTETRKHSGTGLRFVGKYFQGDGHALYYYFFRKGGKTCHLALSGVVDHWWNESGRCFRRDGSDPCKQKPSFPDWW